MYDLLKKLNTLVSAQVNDLASDLASRLPNIERKPDLDRQVAELRQRVAAALEHEDRLRAQVNALQQEIAGLDSRIDAAIQAGHETSARSLLEEVQRLQKRLGLAEADLRQHQTAAADLIIRVNELESAVGDLKSDRKPAPAEAPRVATAKGSVTDYMPPVAEETAKVPSQTASKAPVPPQPAPEKSMPSAPVEDRPMETGTPVAPSAPAVEPEAPAAPAPEKKPEAETPEQPERKPWDPPRTAKEAAEMARDDFKEKSDRATTGVEQVGGLLRDIQARVTQRVNDLDRMLQEGGLMDEDVASTPQKPAENKSKPNPDDDLSDRLSRLSKPE
jgi:phage shock protein A